MAFDGTDSWSFGNEFARNAIILGVDNSSSYHSDNRKSISFLLDEKANNDVNDSVGTTEQKFGTNFTKAKAKFCLNLHYDGDNSCLFVNGKKV